MYYFPFIIAGILIACLVLAACIAFPLNISIKTDDRR